MDNLFLPYLEIFITHSTGCGFSSGLCLYQWALPFRGASCITMTMTTTTETMIHGGYIDSFLRLPGDFPG